MSSAHVSDRRTRAAAKRHIPDQLSAPAEDGLAAAKWRGVSWRKGTKGPLAASVAAVRVRIADGPPQRIHDKGMQHMPGEEAWLVGERRASGERKSYLSNLPQDASLKTPPASRHSLARSRRDGSASKPTSNSSKNSASTTSKADPGAACTATRS